MERASALQPGLPPQFFKIQVAFLAGGAAQKNQRREVVSMTTVVEIENIEGFRKETLERAGYPASLAAELATRLWPGSEDFVELHFACDLIARGCKPEIAARIV